MAQQEKYVAIVVVGTAEGQVIQGAIADGVSYEMARKALERTCRSGAWLTDNNWFAPPVIIEGRIMLKAQYDRLLEDQRNRAKQTDTPPSILTLDK